jgi:transposase
MASLVAGKNNGIAPNADLYLVKTKTRFTGWVQPGVENTGPPQTPHLSTLNYEAMEYYLNLVEEHVTERLAKDPTAKSVINMSRGMYYTEKVTGSCIAQLTIIRIQKHCQRRPYQTYRKRIHSKPTRRFSQILPG